MQLYYEVCQNLYFSITQLTIFRIELGKLCLQCRKKMRFHDIKYIYIVIFTNRNISICKHHTFQLPNFIENNIHKSFGILATAIKPQRKTRKHFLVVSRQHRCCSIGLALSLSWSCLLFRYIFFQFSLYLVF